MEKKFLLIFNLLPEFHETISKVHKQYYSLSFFIKEEASITGPLVCFT